MFDAERIPILILPAKIDPARRRRVTLPHNVRIVPES
jgi:hypothetical protein